MNEVLTFLNSHGSTRQFTDDPISNEQEHQIITTAQRSPTSSNLQAYSILSVREAATKGRLAELSGPQEHVAKSALFLVFCADLHRLAHISRARNYAFHGDTCEAFIVATVDAALAADRALMAAQALGLGGVMVGGIRNQPDKVGDLLGLPELVYPVMGMSLGKPVRPPKVKPRLPRRGLHFQERYDSTGFDDAIADYDRMIDELGYLRGRQVEPDNYSAFDGTYSWSEHSARRMASANPHVTRLFMMDDLQKRGFLKR